MVLFSMNKLVTTKEIASRFSVHPETVRLWVRRGMIPCIRPTSRTIRFNLLEVEKILAKTISRGKARTNWANEL